MSFRGIIKERPNEWDEEDGPHGKGYTPNHLNILFENF